MSARIRILRPGPSPSASPPPGLFDGGLRGGDPPGGAPENGTVGASSEPCANSPSQPLPCSAFKPSPPSDSCGGVRTVGGGRDQTCWRTRLHVFKQKGVLQGLGKTGGVGIAVGGLRLSAFSITCSNSGQIAWLWAKEAQWARSAQARRPRTVCPRHVAACRSASHRGLRRAHRCRRADPPPRRATAPAPCIAGCQPAAPCPPASARPDARRIVMRRAMPKSVSLATPCVVEQDILGLDIPMHHALRMRRAQPVENLHADVHSFGDRHGTPRCSRSRSDSFISGMTR